MSTIVFEGATILLPWLPQTCAPVAKRAAAVSTVLSEVPEIGWKLLVSLLPQSHSTAQFISGIHSGMRTWTPEQIDLLSTSFGRGSDWHGRPELYFYRTVLMDSLPQEFERRLRSSDLRLGLSEWCGVYNKPPPSGTR